MLFTSPLSLAGRKKQNAYPTNGKIKDHFGVLEAYIVYDQPPDFFRPPTLPERHELFTRLARTNPDFADAVRALSNASWRGGPGSVGGDGGGGVDDDDDDGTDRPQQKKARCSSSGAATASDRSRGDAGMRSREEDTPGSTTNDRPPAAAAAGGEAGDVVGRGGRGRGGRGEGGGKEWTLFTTRSAEGVCELRRDRPALLVSSTSWTPDEDFSILLEALRRFDSRTASGASPTLPLVMVVVTGKGPDKAKYVERMRAARMTRVAVCTAWLEPQDYPVLLGSADLGICLHTSTSGENCFFVAGGCVACWLAFVCVFSLPVMSVLCVYFPCQCSKKWSPPPCRCTRPISNFARF